MSINKDLLFSFRPLGSLSLGAKQIKLLHLICNIPQKDDIEAWAQGSR